MSPLTNGPKQDIQTRIKFPWSDDNKRDIKTLIRIRYNIKTNENDKPWTT